MTQKGEPNEKRESRITVTENQAKETDKKLQDLVSDYHSKREITYRGKEIAKRFYEGLVKAVAEGCPWSEILTTMPTSVQKLKPKTLQKYFQMEKKQRQNEVETRAAARKAKSGAFSVTRKSSGKVNCADIPKESKPEYNSDIV